MAKIDERSDYAVGRLPIGFRDALLPYNWMAIGRSDKKGKVPPPDVARRASAQGLKTVMGMLSKEARERAQKTIDNLMEQV